MPSWVRDSVSRMADRIHIEAPPVSFTNRFNRLALGCQFSIRSLHIPIEHHVSLIYLEFCQKWVLFDLFSEKGVQLVMMDQLRSSTSINMPLVLCLYFAAYYTYF